jgi:hypothetical protein
MASVAGFQVHIALLASSFTVSHINFVTGFHRMPSQRPGRWMDLTIVPLRMYCTIVL